MSEESWSLPGFVLGKVLGRGGFSTVFEAEQLSLRRTVALKVLTVDLAAEADRRRFDRERHVLARLSEHPYVVDVHDAGVSGGRPYIVMRLYSRGTLAQRLRAIGPMPVAEVVAVAGKLASALDAAHAMNVIHRDVKPENVLLTDSGEPVLTDFGIAAIVDPDTVSAKGHNSTSFFTMAHVAPEVLEHGHYSVASDVYALASTMYTLLAGRPAFDPTNPRVTSLILDSPAAPIDRPDLPDGVQAALLRGLAKDPAQRYASAGDFARALAAGAGATSPPIGGWAPPAGWGRPAGAAAGAPTEAFGGVPTEALAGPAGERTEPLAPPSRTVALDPVDAPTAQATPGSWAAFGNPPVGHAPGGPGAGRLDGRDPAGLPPAPGLPGPAHPGPGRWKPGGDRFRLIAIAAVVALVLFGISRVIGWPGGGGGCDAPSFSDTAGSAPASPTPSPGAPSPTGTPVPQSGGTSLYSEGYVNAVALSCDGRTVATASQDGTAQIWNSSSRRVVRTLTSGASTVKAVAFSNDGRTVAVGSDNSIQLWEVAIGGQNKGGVATPVDSGSSSPSLRDLAFSPSGDRFAAAYSTGLVQVWNANDNKPAFQLRGHKDDVNAVRFSPDGKLIATGGTDGTLQLWDASDGHHVHTFALEKVSSLTNVKSLAFSADSSWLAATSYGGAVIFNVESHNIQALFKSGAGGYAVALTPDKKTLIVGDSGGSVNLFDAQTTATEPKASYKEHTSSVGSLAISPQGDRIVSSGDYDKTVVLRQLP